MDNTTDAVMTTLAVMEGGESAFNFTGMWISIGVLGGFVFIVVVYGFVIAQIGALKLPQRTEDKEPLSPDQRDNPQDNDVGVYRKKGSIRGDDATAGPSGNATDVTDAAAPPPSYDQVVQGSSAGKGGAKSLVDCEGQTDDGGNIMVEVYEQNVSMADEA